MYGPGLSHVAEELEQLKQRLLIMGTLAEERVRASMRALIERDPVLGQEVLNGDQEINSLQLSSDGQCVAYWDGGDKPVLTVYDVEHDRHFELDTADFGSTLVWIE